MRFATFLYGGRRQSGVVVDDKVHPFEVPAELQEFIKAGEDMLRTAAADALAGTSPLPLADVRLLPCSRPRCGTS